eukprot:503918-Rhodomonas_salina.2
MACAGFMVGLSTWTGPYLVSSPPSPSPICQATSGTNTACAAFSTTGLHKRYGARQPFEPPKT